MPRNDRSDSLSVRDGDDPRKPLKALEQETEVELGWSEGSDTGGVEHQSHVDREGISRDERPEEQATRHMTDASASQLPRRSAPAEDTSAGSPQRTRSEGPEIKHRGG